MADKEKTVEYVVSSLLEVIEQLKTGKRVVEFMRTDFEDPIPANFQGIYVTNKTETYTLKMKVNE